MLDLPTVLGELAMDIAEKRQRIGGLEIANQKLTQVNEAQAKEIAELKLKVDPVVD